MGRGKGWGWGGGGVVGGVGKWRLGTRIDACELGTSKRRGKWRPSSPSVFPWLFVWVVFSLAQQSGVVVLVWQSFPGASSTWAQMPRTRGTARIRHVACEWQQSVQYRQKSRDEWRVSAVRAREEVQDGVREVRLEFCVPRVCPGGCKVQDKGVRSGEYAIFNCRSWASKYVGELHFSAKKVVGRDLVGYELGWTRVVAVANQVTYGNIGQGGRKRRKDGGVGEGRVVRWPNFPGAGSYWTMCSERLIE